MADNAELNDPTARSAPPSLPVAVLQAQMRDIAARLERAGVSHAVMLGAGFVLGIGACAGLAMHANFIALGMLVTSRLFFLLTSHATYRSSAAAALDPILARIALALMPFGFALADSSHALAASFAMLGMLVETIAIQATRTPRAANGSKSDASVSDSADLFAFLASLAMAAACIEPGWFGIAAYGIGILGFAVAGRVVGALVV
jgi:hypothetical protein